MNTFHIILLITAVFTKCAYCADLVLPNCKKGESRLVLECMSNNEAILTKKYGNLLEKKGNILTLKNIHGQQPKYLKLESAIPNSFQDTSDVYTVLEHFEDLSITHIDVRGWEYHRSYVFSHVTGEYKEVFDLVEISPDRKTIVGYNDDLISGWSINGLIIYSIDKSNSLVEVLRKEFDKYGIDSVKFLTNSKIELTTNCFIDLSVWPPLVGTVILESIGKSWSITSEECGGKQR